MNNRGLSCLESAVIFKQVERAQEGRVSYPCCCRLVKVLRVGITTGETTWFPSFANWFLAIKEGGGVS